MKVEPFSYGGLEISAENDAERIWMQQFVSHFAGHRELLPVLSNFIQVDLEEGNVDKDGHPVTYADLEDVIGKDGEVWAPIEKIHIRSFGEYIESELQKRIATIPRTVQRSDVKPEGAAATGSLSHTLSDRKAKLKEAVEESPVDYIDGDGLTKSHINQLIEEVL